MPCSAYRLRRVVVALVASVSIGGCNSAQPSEAPQRAETTTPRAEPSAAQRYFQRRLITDGDDLHSNFGLDIAGLGLKGRELRAMPIDEAYRRTREMVQRVSDVRMRRSMILELFDTTED